MKHGSPVNLACAPLPPSSCNTTIVLTIRLAIRLQFFLTFSLSISSQMFFTFIFLDTVVFYASFFRIIFLYLGARVETGSCRAHSLTLSMPLSPPHKEYYLLCMHAVGSWRLRGQGSQSGLESSPDSRMAHLTLSPYISWSPCAEGGRSLLPLPFLSSQPTPAERLDFGYQWFIQLRSHMSVKLQDNACPLW